MELVGAVHPVADEDRAVRREADANGAELVATFDDGFGLRGERRALRLQLEALQDVVAPGRADQRAAVIRREGVVLVREDARRRLAGAADHRQRPGKLAVPRGEGMQPLAPVAELVAVVAALDHVDQAAGRARVGIVVDREEPAVDVGAAVERVPESRGDLGKLRAVGPAAEDLAAFRIRDGRPVGAHERERCAEVFAHPEVQVAVGVEGEAREAVVRVVPLRLKLHDRVAPLLEFRLAVPAVDLPARGEEEITVLAEAEAHPVAEPFRERRDLAGAAVGAEVLEDEDPVGRPALVVLRGEMGVRLDRPDAALRVDGHARRRVEARLRRNEFHHQAFVHGDGLRKVLRQQQRQ